MFLAQGRAPDAEALIGCERLAKTGDARAAHRRQPATIRPPGRRIGPAPDVLVGQFVQQRGQRLPLRPRRRRHQPRSDVRVRGHWVQAVLSHGLFGADARPISAAERRVDGPSGGSGKSPWHRRLTGYQPFHRHR
jgi:hypothetical protein